MLKSNNKILRTLAIAAISMASFSCSDKFFDVPVGESISTQQHFQTIEDAMASVNGALISIQDVAPKLIILDGLRTDQMEIRPSADMYLKDIYNLNFSVDNPYLNHSDLYKAIINVNEVLSRVDGAAARDRDFKPEVLFDMKANLYGLRAWCYLNIVRLYGQAAWIPNNLSELPESGLKIIPKDELIDSLISQFQNDSVIYDQEQISTSRSQTYFYKYPNYKAVLGELYLERNDYENAIYYLKLGLETAPAQVGNIAYKLDATYAEEGWKFIFFGAENALLENTMVIPFSINYKQPNTMVDLMLPTSQFALIPSQVLVDSMQAQIMTNGDTADVYRGMGVTYDTLPGTNQYYIKKYMIDDAQPLSSDIVLQRAAELHLLLAEALNRSGQSDAALMFLNLGLSNESVSKRPPGYSAFSKNRGVRGRVLLSARTIPDSIPEMERIEMIEDYIIQEKAMECAFEGKRMSDLIRIAERRDNPEEYLSTIIARKYEKSGMSDYAKQFYSNKANWYLPAQ